MPVTTLQFLRKRQAVSDLSRERPQTHAKLRATLLRATNAIQTELRQAEIAFYAHQQPLKTIQKWSYAVRYCLKLCGVRHVNIRSQLDWLLQRMALVPKEPEDHEYVATVLDMVKMFDQAIPQNFTSVIQNVESIVQVMQKYCLSFCPKDEHSERLATAQKYEESRNKYVMTIQKLLMQATGAKHLFQGGFLMRSLPFEVQDIGRKTGCEDYPFILLYAYNTCLIRDACKEVKKWLEEDAQYLDFIKDDVKSLEESREEQLKIIRELKEQIFQARYRYTKLRKDYEQGTGEMEKLQPKLADLQTREARAAAKYNKLRLDLEVVKLRKSEIKKEEASPKSKLTKFEQLELKDTLISELSRTKTQFFEAERKFQHLERSVTWIETKRENVLRTRAEYKSINQDVKMIQRRLEKETEQLESLNRSCGILRDIIRLKESSETLKKIFLHVPLIPVTTKQEPTGQDVLSRAIRIISRHIGTDWMKLYRSLPFSPPRGEEELTMDIKNIDSTMVRGANEDQAKYALNKWRRLNRRAKYADLKHALVEMRRIDVLNELQILFKAKEVKVKQTLEEKFCLPTITC